MNAASNEPLMSGLLVVFGITGDLAHRYLLPALYQLERQKLLPDEFEIIGATRRSAEVPLLLDGIEAELKASGQTADPATLASLGRRLRIVTMDPTKAADYANLKATLDELENERGVCLNRLFYLAIPPQIYGPVVDLLGSSGLNSGCQHGAADSRLMVEKPFGYDLTSATELVERLHHSFSERQIFRIDHYLAKETAQNILVFRFANPIFQAVWNRQHVTSLTITAAETIGIEGRVAFYENVGALRDFVQNHLLQLLAITTMAEPAVLDSSHTHAEKLKLLKAITPIQPNEVTQRAVRGQYRGYREEVGNPDSTTETFARLKLDISNNTWRGVPVTLQTGKRLNERSTTITLTFGASGSSAPANTLTFRIQPNEGIAVELLAKEPGLDQHTKPVEMAFSYAESFGPAPQPNAYERVLMDGIRGDQTLFTTSDEVLTSWRIVDSVVKEWAKSSDGLIIYEPGTPAANI
jgi:glucose-6-phosphate 1-dehydrogenase